MVCLVFGVGLISFHHLKNDTIAKMSPRKKISLPVRKLVVKHRKEKKSFAEIGKLLNLSKLVVKHRKEKKSFAEIGKLLNLSKYNL